MRSSNRFAAVALGVPVLLGLLAAVVFVGAELVGRTPPLAAAPPQNVAEAAGAGSAPDVWRFLAEGQNPLAIHEVRPHIISSSITRVTAGEAAIWSRRVELVQFLDKRQALGGAAARMRLACLARELKTEDIAEYLAANGSPRCSGSVSEDIAARAR